MREKEDEIREKCKGHLLHHGKESEFHSGSKGKSLENLKHQRCMLDLFFRVRVFWPLWRRWTVRG